MEPTTLTIILAIVAIIAALGAVMAQFVCRRWAPALAFGGMVVASIPGVSTIGWATLAFWGIAAAIAIGITILLPKAVADSRMGVAYIVGGVVCGAIVGAILGHAAMILGSVIGAFCGAVAFSRTPNGAAIRFPSKQFVNYVCAKGLPAIVTACIGAITIIESISIL